MGGKSILLSLAFLISTAATPVAAEAAAVNSCALTRIAELPVAMSGGRPVVEVAIGGQTARLLVDTAANFSQISPSASRRLKLRLNALPKGSNVTSRGRVVPASIGIASTFALGGAVADHVQFVVAELSVGDADGILGGNVLGQMEVEYDLGAGVIRLLRGESCKDAALAYWASPDTYSVAPLLPSERFVIIPANLDGRPIRAKLDSAIERSAVELTAVNGSAAKPKGADAEAGGTTPAGGGILPFASFSVGDETIKNTRLRVVRAETEEADMVLGLDFFLSHRILVSQIQKKVYFTYGGGPIFRLDEGRPAPAKFGSSEDAAALAERSRIASARGDYAQALAELDKAIALAPRDPALHLDRAKLAYSRQDFARAKIDLDDTLRLRPDQPQALAMRGAAYLWLNEPMKADADLDAAVRLEPDARVLVGNLYASKGRFDRAVANFDAWLAANGEAKGFAALNGRCWARALWGRDLDAALDDCNRAIRRGGRQATILDSRGMVYLRRGEFVRAIADYDAALKLEPRQPWSLYGRGLARLKRGEASGSADVQAAFALDASLAADSKAWGLTEATIVAAQGH